MTPDTSGYAAWASWLDAFALGEDRPSAGLPAVDEELGPHMQSRLIGRIGEAFIARTRTWNLRLSRELRVATTQGAGAMGAALVAARAQLRPLRQFTENPLFPAELRQELARSLNSMVDSAQESLEQSARRASIGSTALQAIVREHALNARLATPARVAARPAPPPGRRILF